MVTGLFQKEPFRPDPPRQHERAMREELQRITSFRGAATSLPTGMVHEVQIPGNGPDNAAAGRVDPGLREAAESVLQDGETLSGFIETSVRETIAPRGARTEFIARGLASRDEARHTAYFAASTRQRRMRYVFVSFDQLLGDFLADVATGKGIEMGVVAITVDRPNPYE